MCTYIYAYIYMYTHTYLFTGPPSPVSATQEPNHRAHILNKHGNDFGRN